MKKKIVVISLAVAALALTACSDNYALTTKDGKTLISKGKPELDSDTGLISYEDGDGSTKQINKDQVQKMAVLP